MKRWVFVLLLAGLAAFSFAAPAEEIPQEKLDSVKESFNNRTSELPGWLNPLIGKQRINTYIVSSADLEAVQQDKDANITPVMTLGVEMSGKTMERLRDGALSDPTIEVWVSRNDLKEAAESDTPVKTLRSKVQSGEIVYRVHGFINRLRIEILRKALDAVGG